MADEIRVSGSLGYADSEGSDPFLELVETLFDIGAKKYQQCKHNVGLTEEAMKLGELTTLGWCCFKNLDATNYVEIRSATGAANDVILVPALGFAIFHFGSDVTAPFIVANTAACQTEYLILST